MTPHDTPLPDLDPTLAGPGTPVGDTAHAPPSVVPAAPVATHALDAALTDGWQLLPSRARRLFVVGDIVGMLVLAVMLLVPIGIVVDDRTLKLVLAGAVLLLPAAAAWWAGKRYRYTAWRFDADGFALRQGRLWRTETRVPATRVQHLDLKRGPLERRFRLSTLVIHTAGTRHSAVSIAGLDVDDAERLRDALARQRDDKDEDEDDNDNDAVDDDVSRNDDHDDAAGSEPAAAPSPPPATPPPASLTRDA